VRKGSTKDYSENWARAFGKKKTRSKPAKKSAAKSTSVGTRKKSAKSKKK
jgi:hypothetical protein